jgi:succinate dehydrogenase/fumarate reductase flavoprotein subunit
MKSFETDVLIVGGGGAATASTISAHENGASTMLAVKGRFGVPGVRGAGATSNPLGDYWTIRTVGPEGGFFNPPELVYRDMMQTGLGMADPRLCRIFVNEVGDAIKRLQLMGQRFKSKVLATMEANPQYGGTNSIVATQKAVIEATDTHVIENANIIDLIIEDGRCIGAVGIDDDGEPLLIGAGAVILAAGGVGQLFRYSFNPPGNTGDAYAITLRAGADLFNMEFMQQGLATTWPTQAMVMLYDMEQPYRLLNADGKAFLQNYLPQDVSLEEVSKHKASHWPVSCRDLALHLDRAIKAEALAGRGTRNDAVLLDLSGARRGFEPELFIKFMLSKGLDVQHDLLQVQIHHHTSNGGIRIDENAQTSITGLFAAGEAAGWQGADRLGGTMLGGSQVFGWRAGARAAKVAATRPGKNVGPQAFEPCEKQVRAFQESKGDQRPMDLRRGLQKVMWETLLVEKDAETLLRAMQYVEDDRERMRTKLRIAEPADLALAFEHRNLLDVAEVIIAAAAMRTESRGSHYRRDYPSRADNHWLTNIFVSRNNGDLTLRKNWVESEVGWVDQPGDVRIKPWG